MFFPATIKDVPLLLLKAVALKYRRMTRLANEDIALALGFSDAANFRRAFRRWTNKSPNEVRTK
jgi:transcriptional regulator GlxA family with amidase domain